MPFSRVYPCYTQKAEKKWKTKQQVDEIICWLTGYDQEWLERQIADNVDFKTFFEDAPELNPNRRLITWVICGWRVEDMDEWLMQEIRYLDKLIDELAKGKKMESILRS